MPEPYNGIVLDLLFDLATWHALAKLRLHTDTTLAIMEATTRSLGKSRRLFASKSQDYDTREIPREEAARGRREAARAANGPGLAPAQTGKKRKFLNLCTFKWHNLGHYVPGIRWFGTSDAYSTQIVSCFYILRAI